jgi:bacteriocin biosynthesis cyclodehydratase domain-containing protein
MLKLMPFQWIETASGFLLKRGCLEIKINGEGAAKGVRAILAAISHNLVTSQDDIYQLFPPVHHETVKNFIELLIKRRILVSSESEGLSFYAPENSLDVFYWHFGKEAESVTARLNSSRYVILGVNIISRQLAASFQESGIDNYEIVDYPQLRNLRLFDHGDGLKIGQWPTYLRPPIEYEKWEGRHDLRSVDCLVATSDFGGLHALAEWNAICVKYNCHFLPVVLQDLVGQIGPFVIPGETACFECLRFRTNSHLDDPETQSAVDQLAFDGQMVTGFLPSMASVLGSIAAIELTKIYSRVLPMFKVGTLIEVNLLSSKLVTRKVLKLPRCAICSPLNRIPSMTIFKNVFDQPVQPNKR